MKPGKAMKISKYRAKLEEMSNARLADELNEIVLCNDKYDGYSAEWFVVREALRRLRGEDTTCKE